MAKILKLHYSIQGTQPLLMHNAILSDPLNEHTMRVKEISSKRNKTIEDHLELRHREWLGGFYYDSTAGPYLPGPAIDAALCEAAKKNKLGKKFKSALFAEQEVNPLEYEGPRDLDGLWADPRYREVRSVKVMAARCIRCRPCFLSWGASFTLTLMPGELNPSDVDTALEAAGIYVGLGDYRPRYGRFVVTKKSRE